MGLWNHNNAPSLVDGELDINSHDRLRAVSKAALLTVLMLALSATATAITILATGERNWVFAMGLATLIPLLVTPLVVYPISCRNAALNRRNQHLQQLARHDHLTGVFNRPYVLNMLERELALSSRHDYPVSLILIEIQNNSDIVDQLGRHASDKAQQRLAQEVRTQIRESDLLGRFEGAQFILVLPHTGLRDALRISDNLGQLLRRQQITADNQTLPLLPCFGVSSTDQSARTLQSLLNDADYALYNARKQYGDH